MVARLEAHRAVVVAQLVQQSLPLSEVHSSNPVIGKIYIVHLFFVNFTEKKTKLKKKGQEWPIKNRPLNAFKID